MKFSTIEDGVLTRVDGLDIVGGRFDIPEDVVEIGNTAFFNKNEIQSLRIPKTLKRIKGGAMGDFVQLQVIEVDAENPTFVSENGCLTELDMFGRKVIVRASELGFVKQGVGVIGICAFKNSSRQNVFIPKSVNEIETEAFRKCKNLESVWFEAGSDRVRIGMDAFRDCEKLKEVMFSENLYAISNCAFKGCSSLETIDLPSGVLVIGIGAFENCKKLNTFVIPFGVKNIGANAFNNCPNLKTFVVEYEKGKFQEVDRQWLCDQLGIQQNDFVGRQNCHKMRMLTKKVAKQAENSMNPLGAATIMTREATQTLKTSSKDEIQK